MKYSDPILGAKADNDVAAAYMKASFMATGIQPYLSMNGLINIPEKT